MHTHTNRLAEEKSPYLLQHAHNPVNWYPWGEEAFKKAGEEDKPVFLSIGYATCHWCHVMEKESFENSEIADLMNQAFVCVKVDREERPDVDQIYMTVCQMMTGQGGWPLSIIMTPDKKPFHAATYIPPDQRSGRMGMKQLIPRVSHVWNNERDRVMESAGQITDVLSKQQGTGEGAPVSAEILDHGHRELMREYDSNYGGFGQQPKFPLPHRLIFLLRHGHAEGIQAVEKTLEAMRMGGIFDQIGFGFHRYSTDRQWLLPHFEKMLYDQALLALAYTEAFEATGRHIYKQVVEEILDYVLRIMTSPEGAFYSAEDADTEGEEGLYYTWTADEARAVLGSEYTYASENWNLSATGNFHDESTGQLTGKNIPYLSAWPRQHETARLDAARKHLQEERCRRVHPLKDTKVLTDWNGLMTAAFAKAGRVFDRPRWIDTAIRAYAFIKSEAAQENGALWHRWRDGDQAVDGQLEDYAFIIFALLELYESTFDIQYIESALKYNDILAEAFRDRERGGYFMTADYAETLIVRPKEIYDGAVPSGNSVQMHNLLRLARMTGRSELEEEALAACNAFGDMVSRAPSNFAQALIALQYAFGESIEIVIVGERNHPVVVQMLKYIRSVYLPGKVVLLKEPGSSKALARLAPFTKNQETVDGKPAVYICRNFTCNRPVNSLEALQQQLK